MKSCHKIVWNPIFCDGVILWVYKHVVKERSDGLEYYKRISYEHDCVKACYTRAKTMSWLRDLLGFTSSLAQLIWD
jgi:hypothetical protein